MTEFNDYLLLVRRLGAGGINRSENDLSSNLKNALTSFGVHGVVDTGSGRIRLKRPDIALYSERDAADIGSAADVVIEAKKPSEIGPVDSLLDALSEDGLWHGKFVPYVTAHSERISYFILTTFDKFLVVPIQPETRRIIQDDSAFPDLPSRRAALRCAVEFSLDDEAGENLLWRWCETHLRPEALSPPALSGISDLHAVDDADTLERFASDLADIVVGPEGRGELSGALLSTIRAGGSNLENLAPEVQRALVIYTMAAHGGMAVDAAQAYIDEHWQSEWSDFVGASVHSLIGRLFAIKVIEDSFCVGTEPPLIPRPEWIFHTARFDQVTLGELPQRFFEALAGLSQVENGAVKDLAATGRFYDWLAPQVDGAAFRRLISVFFSHNFARLGEDLLGRFFEIYAQRVDRRRRKQLGQYYTPLPIVRCMWRLAMDIVHERGVLEELLALDPGVGSGTFLIEGANQLHNAGLPRFWERLTGFDISPQAIGIAQINVYLAILAHLDRNEAEAVGTLQLYPTDTLDPRNGERLRSIMPLLADESTRLFLQSRIDLSETVKRRSRFPLVIGNPPYRNNSNQTLAQISDRFPSLLRSSRANAGARKRNIRDDYAWFFAAADHYVADRGIVAFVVSDSFCYAASYRFFREDLLRRYRIRNLIILGASVFRDVGPRTQFVIVILERRLEDLGRADDVEPIPVVDLRPLATNPTTVGTPNDPRLAMLGSDELPEAQEYLPNRARNFTLFPEADLVRMVETFPNVLHGDSPRRVFIKKWPGIITAFDELFRADTRDEVALKAERFFAACALEGDARETALDQFARAIRATGSKKRERLSLMANVASAGGLMLDLSRVKRVVTGSAPNEVAWYPDERLHCWIYYEPRLRIPRNVHEGRNPGYGTMSQWRDADSHLIDPKFIFTTGTNPDYGLKALVVPGDWMVKLHGGESQQFHYTGLNNPISEPSLSGPNNLGADAQEFHHALVEAGRASEEMLFYLAGIYNSQITEDYLAGGGASTMRIPLSPDLISRGAVDRVIEISAEMRNLHWISAEAQTGMHAELIETLITPEACRALGLAEVPGTGGRFRQRRMWISTADSGALIDCRVSQLRPQLDEAVAELFAAN